MKTAHTVALSRATSATFLPLMEHEVVKLRQVPAWMRWLYLELVGLADFKTGKGAAGWQQLVALLEWDQPERGRRAAPDLGLQQIRRAFEQLASLGLIARDKARNEAQGRLFFQVSPRVGMSASKRKTDRVSDRPRRDDSTYETKPERTRLPTGNPTGGTTTNSSPSPRSSKLSTALPRVHQKAPAHVHDLIEQLHRRAGGEKRAPKGADQSGLRPTPPGAAPHVSPQGDPFPPEQPSTDRRGGKGAATMKPLSALMPGRPL